MTTRHGPARIPQTSGSATSGKAVAKPTAERKSVAPHATPMKASSKPPAPTFEERLAATEAELAATRGEIARLAKRVARLETELGAVRDDRAHRGPPPLPMPEASSGSTIDITDVAELIEPPRRPRV